MELPNYSGGSIVNLMSSIETAFGGKPRYAPLKMLPEETLKNKTVVLILIDALGYEYIIKNRSFLSTGLKGKMTSVFPSTTAAAITSIATGEGPQQHAITGWFMYLKEANLVSMPFPFVSRINGESLKKHGLEMKKILNISPFTKRISAESVYISKNKLTKTDYTKLMAFNKSIGCKNLADFFRKIRQASASRKKRYIFAYWPDFDNICHKNGAGSIQTKAHFKRIAAGIEKLIKKSGRNTVFIITGDHGQINSKKTIKLEDHPLLKKCLRMPLCGETRAAYCYVHPSKANEFEKYVRTKMKKYCWIYKSREILKRHFFGLFSENKKLKDRIGDYVLIMKKEYIIRDFLSDAERKNILVGNHGGVSKEEMHIPLIIFSK